MMQQNNPR